MFINGDAYWVNILNDAVVTSNNNVHSTIKMTLVDASNNPDKVRYPFNFKNIKLRKITMITGMLTNVAFSLKYAVLTGIGNYLKIMKFQKPNH